MRYDVIIVGARCAGAALGTFLSRSGVDTLLLDANARYSDMPMSTHYVHPPGMDVLDELGIGDDVRRATPASRRTQYRLDRYHFVAEYPDRRAACCVRRSTLDPLLQEVAQSAGCELRESARVVELIKDKERVRGVVVEQAGRRERLEADLVVGADGRHSTVARFAMLEEYLSFPMTRGGYWMYFPTPALWRDDPRFADWDAFVGYEGDGLRYIFQCDGDLLLLAAAPPNAEARGWHDDYVGNTMNYFKRSEVTRPIVEASAPIGKGVGLLKANFFYRRAVAPGVALVGDAGTFKDFVTGHGMTDAFIGAQRLHAAILIGTEAAYERYWRERDVETLPLFMDAIRLGQVGFNNPFNRALFETLSRNPGLARRLPEIADRRRSPLTAFTQTELISIVLRAVVRGRLNVLPHFVRIGKGMQATAAEIGRRAKLLGELAVEDLTEHAQTARPPLHSRLAS